MSHRGFLIALASVAAWVGWSGAAGAQSVPFYYGGATIAEPQISSIAIGSALRVSRAVVSADHKYVTLDIDPQLTSNQGFRTFTFQQAAMGFVGSAAATAQLAPHHSLISTPAPDSLTPSIAALPSALAPPPSPLDAPGMTLVAPLQK